MCISDRTHRHSVIVHVYFHTSLLFRAVRPKTTEFDILCMSMSKGVSLWYAIKKRNAQTIKHLPVQLGV